MGICSISLIVSVHCLSLLLTQSLTHLVLTPGLQAPLPLAAQQVRFYGDGTDYIEKINKYIWKRNLLPIKFDTTQAKSGLYVSSVRVDGKVFGSIGKKLLITVAHVRILILSQ